MSEKKRHKNLRMANSIFLSVLRGQGGVPWGHIMENEFDSLELRTHLQIWTFCETSQSYSVRLIPVSTRTITGTVIVLYIM